jgi:secondary thiamine-phosphate synthase enzyme
MTKPIQSHFSVGPFPRGYHLITDKVLRHAGELPESGLLHIFVRHTSAGLTINENADPDVRNDFALYFDRIAPENLPGMQHTLEGPDDMPAHIKASLVGSSVSIPIVNHGLALGTWQGIYLCEFRNRAGRRQLVTTVLS